MWSEVVVIYFIIRTTLSVINFCAVRIECYLKELLNNSNDNDNNKSKREQMGVTDTSYQNFYGK